MREQFRGFSWPQAVPRLAADLVIVHIAAILSLVGALVWQPGGVAADLAARVQALESYYFRTFLPLSFLFPAVFLLHGVYTRGRAFASAYKWRMVAQGAAVSSLVYVFANFLATRADQLPRSATVLFLGLVIGGTVGVRLIKSSLASLAAAAEASPPAAAQPGPVLVVGGAGYIGSIVCRKLIERGRRVRVLDSLVYGNQAVRGLLGHPRFELVVGDCRNIQNVVAAVNGASSVIHLAAIVGDPACEQDRKAALEINYAATRMMIEVAKGYGVGRFVFASSCSVYGETEELVDERSRVHPISLYAQTKADSEQALLNGRTARFHPVILRLATVFGHSCRPRFDLVVNLLTAKAVQDGAITIYNGEQWRPFLHVTDVAEGILQVLEAPLETVSGQIFNLGDSRLNFTLSGVAARIQAIVPGVRVEHVENPDRRNYRVSFDKIRNRVGFASRTGLDDGIRELARAVSDRQVADYTDPVYHNQRYLKAAGRLIPKEEMDAQVMAAFACAIQNAGEPLAEAG